MKNTRTKTARKNIKKSFPPVPLISLRVEEDKLLSKMINGKRLNINNYSDMFKIPRSTTRSRLKKLDRIGLVSYKPHNATITKTGKIYLENIAILREKTSRIGTRKKAKKNELSTHWHKFSFEIKSRKKFREERLNFINCSWKENKGMKNWNELILMFNDATITIKPKTLILELKDIVEKNVSEVDSKCLRRMIEYSELLNSIGIELGKTTIERGHWARIDSLLSDIIYKKIGEKYYLLDESGKKIFWIDFSKDETGKRKIEDEVPDKLARENLDHNIDQQLNNKFDFDKIDNNSDDLNETKKIMLGQAKLNIQSAKQIKQNAKNQKNFSEEMVIYGKEISAHRKSIKQLGAGVEIQNKIQLKTLKVLERMEKKL